MTVGTEVLLHARARDVVLDERVLRALLLLVPRDDLLDGEPTRRRDAGAIDEGRGRAFVEPEHHHVARAGHGETR